MSITFRLNSILVWMQIFHIHMAQITFICLITSNVCCNSYVILKCKCQKIYYNITISTDVGLQQQPMQVRSGDTDAPTKLKADDKEQRMLLNSDVDNLIKHLFLRKTPAALNQWIYTASSSKMCATMCEIQPKTGGTIHKLASSWTAKVSGRTRTMFPGRPPPVMWAAAFTSPDLSTGRVLLTYILVDVSRLWPETWWLYNVIKHGHCGVVDHLVKHQICDQQVMGSSLGWSTAAL